MQMLETNSRLKDTIEVSTNYRTIRAAVEDLANKAFLTFSPRVECFHISIVLIGLSKDKQRTILEHRRKVPAIDTQAMSRALDIRVQTQEGDTTISLQETLAKVLIKIYILGFDREAKVIIDLDNQQCPPRDTDRPSDSVIGGCIADNDSALFDVHSYASLDTLFCQNVRKRAEVIEVSS